MLGLAAYAKVPNDTVSLRVDNIHAVTAAVRYIDQRREVTNHGTKIAGRVGRIDVAFVQDGWHARQRARAGIGGGQYEEGRDGATKESRRFHGDVRCGSNRAQR